MKQDLYRIVSDFLFAENPKKRKKRNCLKCDVKFLSKGNHNRVCDECRAVNEHLLVSSLYRRLYVK